MRAEVHTATEIVGFAFHTQFAPTSTRGDDDSRSNEHFTTFYADFFGAVLQGCAFDLAILKDINGVCTNVLAEIRSKFSTRGLRHRDKILDAYGVFDLSTDAFCYDRHIQSLARGINGGQHYRQGHHPLRARHSCDG